MEVVSTLWEQAGWGAGQGRAGTQWPSLRGRTRRGHREVGAQREERAPRRDRPDHLLAVTHAERDPGPSGLASLASSAFESTNWYQPRSICW